MHEQPPQDPKAIADTLRATIRTTLTDSAAETEDVASLIATLQGELRRIAGGMFAGERAGHTLQPTAVVNEACVRLLAGEEIGPMERTRFFALAATVMRRVLIDHARAAGRDKRGGGRNRVTLGDHAGPQKEDMDLTDLLALDDALEELSRLDARKARLVELRFFGGLSLEQAAQSLGIARSTASEDWRMARAWLLRRIKTDTPTDDEA